MELEAEQGPRGSVGAFEVSASRARLEQPGQAGATAVLGCRTAMPGEAEQRHPGASGQSVQVPSTLAYNDDKIYRS